MKLSRTHPAHCTTHILPPPFPPRMVENEAAEESRDNPVSPKGVSALLDSDGVQSLTSLKKSSGSSRKSRRLDLQTEITAGKEDNATSGSQSDQTPSPKLTVAETNLTDPSSRDLLTSLPLELLGEILIYTRSTKDILLVARCCKHLLKTLTGPSAVFIWKKTRRIALPKPMPDPPSVLSEYAYALMVYGDGKCEVSVTVRWTHGSA